MRGPNQRPRVGRRRDGGVRQIRSDIAQRYPGVEMPPTDEIAETGALESGDGRRLSPALDTGLEVQTRTARAQASAERRGRLAALAAVAVIITLITAAIGWHYISDKLAAATPFVRGLTAPGHVAAASASKGVSATTAAAAATPIFAYYRNVQLHLPVPMKSLTEIGFHQASYAWALHLKTTMKDAKLSVVSRTKTTGRDRAAEPSGPDAVMTGQVIRMWRARPGRPDTAADVGALAGTTVLAPVTGTVVRIKSYMLYGRYPDYEMHIIPDGTTGLDVVMIHLTDLSCSAGDHVEAGVTPLAKIRKFSDKFRDQLAEYTQSPGDHVHIQVNDSNYKGYRGLDGAVDPGEYGGTTGSD